MPGNHHRHHLPKTSDGESLDINYLCKAHPKRHMIAQARQLQQQGAEVLLRLMDTPSTHWNKFGCAHCETR